MFKKVLIVDDHDVVNEGIRSLIKKLGIQEVERAQYCDEAFIKIKKGTLDKAPFDLLITDLSFKQDHRESKLCSGEDLVASLRPDYPDLKIIVYSMEDRLQKVRTLVSKYSVNAYVCKGRKGAADLERAILTVCNNDMFLSHPVENALTAKTDSEINDFDIELLKQLSLGLSQGQISELFEKNNLSPSSLSSLEKRINRLKDQFKANNTIHLVSIVKDLGLI